MADLTQLVADALFQTELGPDPCTDSHIGRPDCETLAHSALQAVRAQGWRIVKTGPDGIRHGSKPHVAIFEEWPG